MTERAKSCVLLRRRSTLSLGASALVVPSVQRGTAASIATAHAGEPLVFEAGPHPGVPIGVGDLIPGDPPILARIESSESASGSLSGNKRSRSNQVLLLRLPPARLAAQDAVGGNAVVGFSAICTHAGCLVSGWKPAEGHLACPCHGSVYDPASGGQVVGGPAPRPLPALPLRLTDGMLTAAGAFTAWVGGSTGRTD